MCRFTSDYNSVLQVLGTRIQALEYDNAALRRSHPGTETALAPVELDRELLKLVAIAHPDKCAGSPVATELTTAVLTLCDKISGGAQCIRFP